MFKILRPAFLVLVCSVGCFCIQPAAATAITTFPITPPLVPVLPNGGTPVVIFSQPITQISGEILKASTEFTVSNPNENGAADVWTKLVLSSQTGGTTGTVLDQANEKLDVRPGNHHCVRLKSGVKTFPSVITGNSLLYLNVVVWTDNTDQLQLTVDKGALEGMVITPSTGVSFNVYDSGTSGELLTNISADDQFHAVYSVNVGDLANNDFLIVFTDAQVTASGLGVDDVETITTRLLRVDSGGASTFLNAQNNFNIVTRDPTANPVKVAVHQVSGDTTRNLVQLHLRSTTPLNVQQDGGRLEVLKIHQAP